MSPFGTNLHATTWNSCVTKCSAEKHSPNGLCVFVFTTDMALPTAVTTGHKWYNICHCKVKHNSFFLLINWWLMFTCNSVIKIIVFYLSSYLFIIRCITSPVLEYVTGLGNVMIFIVITTHIWLKYVKISISAQNCIPEQLHVYLE